MQLHSTLVLTNNPPYIGVNVCIGVCVGNNGDSVAALTLDPHPAIASNGIIYKMIFIFVLKKRYQPVNIFTSPMG